MQRKLLLCVCLLVLCSGMHSSAIHISDNIRKFSDFRDSLGPGEGYLQFMANPMALRFGDEWTGWITNAHPALTGPRGGSAAYDRSDHVVNVRTTTLIDETGGGPMPNIPRDLDFANRAFMLQAGLSVSEVSHRQITSPPVGQPSSFNFPLDIGEETAIKTAFNDVTPTVDVYYATTLSSNAFGETYVPAVGPNPAVFMADFQAAPPPLPPIPVRPDTFAHEVAHFVSDGRAVHAEDPPDLAHSSDNANLLAGANRNIPSSGGFGLLEIGPVKGAGVGGKDQLTTSPDNPAGPFPQNVSQVERIFSSAAGANGNNSQLFVVTNDNEAAGHRVDWDFVTDHLSLEKIGNRADNHPGQDALFWRIGTT